MAKFVELSADEHITLEELFGEEPKAEVMCNPEQKQKEEEDANH